MLQLILCWQVRSQTYQLKSTFQVLHPWVGFWPFPQTPEKAGNACQETNTQAYYMFPSKATDLPIEEHLSGASTQGRLLALPTSIRLGSKSLSGTSTLANYMFTSKATDFQVLHPRVGFWPYPQTLD